MKLSEISNVKLNESKQEDEAFVKSFLADYGIHSKSAVDSVWNLAKQHHAEANRISSDVQFNTIMAGEKVFASGKDFFKVVTALRKALSDRRSSAPVQAGTRLIMNVTELDKLDDIKEFVKVHNKANKEDKIKLGIYDRQANKEIKTAYKKLWIDGSSEAVAKVKKAFP